MKKWIFILICCLIMSLIAGMIFGVIFEILGIRFYLIIWAMEHSAPRWFITFLMGGYM